MEIKSAKNVNSLEFSFLSEKFFVLVKSYSILLYAFAAHHEKAFFLRSLFDKKTIRKKKIIIPVFTLGSIYSTNASGAVQMPETINSN